MQPDSTDLIRACAQDLGLTITEVWAIAGNAPQRYKIYDIPKRSGGTRTISHPSRELKAIQHFFLYEILADLPVHSTATAYEIGTSIKLNARAHIPSRVILKLDFDSFFPSLKTDRWLLFVEDHFPHWSPSEIEFATQILFWGNRTRTPQCLAIGAPTSPHLSNAMLLEFDEIITAYAQDNGLVYTRYADDITLSSTEYLDKDKAIKFINELLPKLKYSNLKLNPEKTRLFSKAFARRITGLVITNDGRVSLGRNRKRMLGALVHKKKLQLLTQAQTRKTQGLLAFALDAEPEFVDRLRKKYGAATIQLILAGK